MYIHMQQYTSGSKYMAKAIAWKVALDPMGQGHLSKEELWKLWQVVAWYATNIEDEKPRSSLTLDVYMFMHHV